MCMHVCVCVYMHHVCVCVCVYMCMRVCIESLLSISVCKHLGLVVVQVRCSKYPLLQ